MTDERRADAATITAIRNGDRERYRELVERHMNQVFAVAWCRLGDRWLAEDAAQEAFIKGFQRLDLLSQTEKFGSWIVAIARNAAINLGLRHRSELRNHRRWMLERPVESEQPGEEPEGQPTAETVRTALAQLPAIHRECLVLFYLEGKSGAEAAAVLGLSEPAFKTRLHRARSALRSLLETRLEASMERLRPSDKLPGAVMLAIATQKPAWPLFGAIGAAAAKIVPFSLVYVAIQVAGMLPSFLLHWWQGRAERANFRDPHGFRVTNQRRLRLREFILIIVAFFVIVPLYARFATTISLSGMRLNPATPLQIVAPFGALALLSLGRHFLLIRNRFMVAMLVSNVFLFAGAVVTGFLGWNLAWMIAAAAFSGLTLSFVIADAPGRMDYSLFLRAATGLLKADDPTEEASEPAGTTAHARFRFAQFLAERYLVSDWRTRPDALWLRLARVTPLGWTHVYSLFWRSSSALVLKQDGHVSAHLGKGDLRDLKGLRASTASETEHPEATVARSVQRAWAAYARGETARAEAALGEEASKAIFRKDPAKAAFARSNVWSLRLGAVLIAAQAIFMGGRFFPALSTPEWGQRGQDLSEQEVRARLNAIVALAETSADDWKKLDSRWYVKLILPSRDWFTPEMGAVIDAQLVRGLEMHQRVGRGTVPIGQLPVPLHDANEAALDYKVFQNAVIWDLVRTEDLPRFGVSRDGLRQAISELPDKDRRVLTALTNEESVGNSQLDLARLCCRMRFLERMNCLDLLDLTQPVARLRALQVTPAHPPANLSPAGSPPSDGLFSGANPYNAMVDTYQALTILRICGSLNQIDREACIQAILGIHEWKSRSPGLFFTQDASLTYCCYESLRILKAQDRVHDWPSWHRWPEANNEMLESVSQTLREEWILENWLLRQAFERRLAGGAAQRWAIN